VRPVAWALLAATLSGCTYHLRVESFPNGATLTIDDAETHVLPTDLYLKWRAFRPYPVRVEANGYRPLVFELRRRHLHEIDFVTDVIVNPNEAFGDAPRRVLEVRLVPEHGPSGTWSYDDLER